MKKLLIAGSLFLMGCGPVLLVHPKTGERVICQRELGLCQQYEGLGFIRAEKLTPEQKANLVSKPTPIGIEQDITIRQAPVK